MLPVIVPCVARQALVPGSQATCPDASASTACSMPAQSDGIGSIRRRTNLPSLRIAFARKEPDRFKSRFAFGGPLCVAAAARWRALVHAPVTALGTDVPPQAS